MSQACRCSRIVPPELLAQTFHIDPSLIPSASLQRVQSVSSCPRELFLTILFAVVSLIFISFCLRGIRTNIENCMQARISCWSQKSLLPCAFNSQCKYFKRTVVFSKTSTCVHWQFNDQASALKKCFIWLNLSVRPAVLVEMLTFCYKCQQTGDITTTKTSPTSIHKFKEILVLFSLQFWPVLHLSFVLSFYKVHLLFFSISLLSFADVHCWEFFMVSWKEHYLRLNIKQWM